MDISLNIRKRSFSGQYDVNKWVICQCHRKCYSEFTHQKQIKTFEARAEGQKVDVESPKQEHGVICSDSMAPSTSKYSSRRSVKPADWNLCIFVRLPTKISCSIFQRFLSAIRSCKIQNWKTLCVYV